MYVKWRNIDEEWENCSLQYDCSKLLMFIRKNIFYFTGMMLQSTIIKCRVESLPRTQALLGAKRYGNVINGGKTELREPTFLSGQDVKVTWRTPCHAHVTTPCARDHFRSTSSVLELVFWVENKHRKLFVSFVGIFVVISRLSRPKEYFSPPLTYLGKLKSLACSASLCSWTRCANSAVTHNLRLFG